MDLHATVYPVEPSLLNLDHLGRNFKLMETLLRLECTFLGLSAQGVSLGSPYHLSTACLSKGSNAAAVGIA